MEPDRLALLFELLRFGAEQERQATDLLLDKLSLSDQEDSMLRFEEGWIGILQEDK